MAKQKFYVVWKGVNPGIYSSWTDCQLQIQGYKGAIYKSFESLLIHRKRQNMPLLLLRIST